MTDRELDALVGGANPVAERELHALDLGAGERALRDGLMAAASQAPPIPAAAPRRRLLRARRLAVAFAVVAGAAAAILTVTALSDRGGAGGPDTAWAAPLVRLAESSPLLVLGDDDWKVTRADEYGRREGEMSFSGPGGAQAGLFWRAQDLAALRRDRANSAAEVVRGTVLGHPAQLTQYAGAHDEPIADFTAIWADDDGRTTEVRANTPDLAAFRALLTTVRRVDVDGWLSSLPASTIKQANRGAAVDAMLKGIPLPPGFDAQVVKDQPLTSDRYQLGVAVSGAVACAWIARWDHARKAGDGATAAAAVKAMGTAGDWPILKEMAKTGAYPQVLTEYAEAMAGPGDWHGRPLKAEARSGLGCR